MKKIFTLLVFVLGTALAHSQSYEKFYFSEKSTGEVSSTLFGHEPTNGSITLNYTDSTVVVSLYEDDIIHFDCLLIKADAEEHLKNVSKISSNLKHIKTYCGKTPDNKDIIMIQWSGPDNGTNNKEKYAYTFIVDGIETSYYCSERYVKLAYDNKLKFYKLKDW